MIARRFSAVAVAMVAAWVGAAPVPAVTDDQLKDQALKLNSLTTTDAMQTKLTEVLKDKAIAKRLVGVAAGLQAGAKPGESPFKFNAAFLLGKVAHNLKDYKNAETFYLFCKESAVKLDSGSQMAQAYDGLIDLYWDQKKFQDVEQLCADLLESDAKGKEMNAAKSLAIERMVQSKARRGEHDEALNMVNRFVELDKKGWYALQLKGYVLREAGKLDDAIDTYTEVIKRIEKDKTIKGEEKSRIVRNARYVMTGLYVDGKKIDEAAKILEDLIKEEPDSATYYNDLGFIWADNDLKYEESEKLIRKALELDEKMRAKLLKEGKIDEETAKKTNAAYLDSLGWVLYKNKKYDEAKKYLLESIKDDEEGAHMEIWDHLADVYIAQGDSKKAVEYWTKALKFEDLSKRDAERRKKITEKLKKAKAGLKKDD